MREMCLGSKKVKNTDLEDETDPQNASSVCRRITSVLILDMLPQEAKLKTTRKKSRDVWMSFGSTKTWES